MSNPFDDFEKQDTMETALECDVTIETSSIDSARSSVLTRFTRIFKDIGLFATFATGMSVCTGCGVNGSVREVSNNRTAIAIQVPDPDCDPSKHDEVSDSCRDFLYPTVGFAYGAEVGTPREHLGLDNAVPIDPLRFKRDGDLYLMYKALAVLEDRGMDDWLAMSPYLGVSPESVARATFWNVLGYDGGGASTVADQTCDIMYSYDMRGLKKKASSALWCGPSLAFWNSSEKLATLYLQHVQIAPKANGVETFRHEYFGGAEWTEARQLLAVAMIKYPWEPIQVRQERKEREDRWGEICDRAKYAARVMFSEGVIDKKKYDEILESIDEEPMPFTYDEVKGRVRSNLQAREGYDSPSLMAFSEMRGDLGDDWRAKVDSFELTVDRNVLGATKIATVAELKKLSEKSAALTGIANGRGEILGLYSGTLNGADQVKRWVTERPELSQSGSISKLFLAASLNEARKLGNWKHDWFYKDLGQSSNDIWSAAKSVGLNEAKVASLIYCYGELRDTERGAAESATHGWINISPKSMLQFMYESQTGIPMPEPHTVRSYVLNDGRRVQAVPVYRENAERCASLAYAGGKTSTWTTAPVEYSGGTLHSLEGIADFGKTGTVGDFGRGYNRKSQVVAGARAYDNTFVVYTGFGPDNLEADRKLGLSEREAMPVAKMVLASALDRNCEMLEVRGVTVDESKCEPVRKVEKSSRKRVVASNQPSEPPKRRASLGNDWNFPPEPYAPVERRVIERPVPPVRRTVVSRPEVVEPTPVERRTVPGVMTAAPETTGSGTYEATDRYFGGRLFLMRGNGCEAMALSSMDQGVYYDTIFRELLEKGCKTCIRKSGSTYSVDSGCTLTKVAMNGN
ncbi:transglycosylase domain-containing protein [Patescibacteria group bacterium]|nr:transglycosylase domain-containing protein [Patescibacteria group bacterium]